MLRSTHSCLQLLSMHSQPKIIPVFPAKVPEKLRLAAKQAQTPVSLRSLVDFGQHSSVTERALLSAQWLHRELPIRLAHRVQELASLPHDLCRMPSVIKVREMYEQSFFDVVGQGKPQNHDDEKQFSDMLDQIYHRHKDVVKLIAKGCIELRQFTGSKSADVAVHGFLDRFYMSRIGIRMLIAQHLGIRQVKTSQSRDDVHEKDITSSPHTTGASSLSSRANKATSDLDNDHSRQDHDHCDHTCNHPHHYVGIIRYNCNPATVARDAADAAISICYRTYGDAPQVKILGNNKLTFPYVESHMFLCLFELLKNSIRATIETHQYEDSVPDVKVIIADGSEDATIKIADEGGGIPRSSVDKIFTYLFSTAEIPPEKLLEMDEKGDDCAVLAGYGYGIPLSRLYARYFGGDLTIVSMDGYGTDAYLHLNKLGDKLEAIK